MKPVTLHDLAGWYHPGRAARGVVIVPALGFEELTSRRSLRILADEIALLGLPVLRFDYHGTADSGGDVLEPGRLERWRADIHRAIDCMFDHGGVSEVTLVGLRFGALMAAKAASEREDIASLALLAPPLSGKAYLREQTMLASVIGKADPVADGLTVAGFRLTGETMDEIRTMGWPRPAAPLPVLVCEPANGMAKGRIEAAFGHRAAALHELPFAGYEAMICDPTASVVPLATLTQVARHLAAGVEGEAEPIFSHAPPQLRGPDFTEEGVTFGDNHRLAGVFCQPHQARAGKPVVIIANAGGSPHIGWARGTVDLARRLAGAGIASLRMDMGGLGDSKAVFEREVPHHYLEATRHDLVAAVDWVAGRGHDSIALTGICSGAHHSFHAALMDRRVKKLILVNTLCFIWGAEYAMPLNAWSRARPGSVALDMQQRDATLGLFRRLQVRLHAGGRNIVRRLAKLALRQAAALRKPRVQAGAGGNEVLQAFDFLREHGVEVHLVYSENDQGLAELEKYAGDDLSQMTTLPGIVKRIVPEADHTFTTQASRDQLASHYLEAMMAGFTAKRGIKGDATGLCHRRAHLLTG